MSANDPAVSDAGRKLDTLRTMRRIADYELDDPNPQSSRWAHRQLQLAIKIIALLEQWQNQKNFVQTVESIRTFSRDVLRINVRDLD